MVPHAESSAHLAARDVRCGLFGSCVCERVIISCPRQGLDSVVLDGAQVLDLETLQFEGGAHYLASKTVQLPEESFTRDCKGYKEVRPL